MEELLGRLRALQADDDSRSEALRMFGGLLLGAAAFVLALRTSSLDNQWAGFPELLVYLLPGAFLLTIGFAARQAIGESRSWHAVFVVFGLVFVPFVGLQFVDMIGGNTGANLNVVWIFGVTAAVAWFAGKNSIQFGWLACGLSLLIVWIAFWNEVISDGIGSDIDTFRLLALIAAAGLIGGGYKIRNRDGEIGRARAAEWFTAGGIAFVTGAGLFSLVGATAGLLGPLSVDPLSAAGSPAGVYGGAADVGGPSVGWDALLGIGSALLIGAGSLYRHRGPVYVGAAGLFLFVFLVGLDLDDNSPSGHVLGWPVILFLLAAAVLALSVGDVRNRIASARTTAGPPDGGPPSDPPPASSPPA